MIHSDWKHDLKAVWLGSTVKPREEKGQSVHQSIPMGFVKHLLTLPGSANELRVLSKLDGVGPVDNRPSIN